MMDANDQDIYQKRPAVGGVPQPQPQPQPQQPKEVQVLAPPEVQVVGVGLEEDKPKRRFFPRVKHLLTREWEPFLAGILDALEEVDAPSCHAASHKSTNAWFKAFDLVYGNVAADCSIPTGKNRFHKFKDKITELWHAMETDAPDDHPLKARALQQLAIYRRACEAVVVSYPYASAHPGTTTNTNNNPDLSTPSPSKKRPPPPPSLVDYHHHNNNKRPYTSTFRPTAGRAWKHLDEKVALANLPQPLRKLVHLRHMGLEIGATTTVNNNNNKQTVEVQYQQALQEYLQQSQSSQQQQQQQDPFDKAQALVLLHRLSQSVREAKEILTAYEEVVATI